MTDRFGSMLKGLIGCFLAGLGFYTALFSFIALFASVLIAQLLPNMIYAVPLGIGGFIIGVVLWLFGIKLYFDNISALSRLIIGVIGLFILFVGITIGMALTVTGVGAIPGIFAMLVAISTGYGFIHVGFGINLIPFLDSIIDRFFKFVTNMMKVVPKI